MPFLFLFFLADITEQHGNGHRNMPCDVGRTHLQTFVYALVFGHCLKAISSCMSLTEKQSAIVCSNKTTTRPAGVTIFKSHVDLDHQVESFLCCLLLCLVVNRAVTQSDLLPHAIVVRAQCWSAQAEDCRLCFLLLPGCNACHHRVKLSCGTALGLSDAFFCIAHSANLRSFLGPSF